MRSKFLGCIIKSVWSPPSLAYLQKSGWRRRDAGVANHPVRPPALDALSVVAAACCSSALSFCAKSQSSSSPLVMHTPSAWPNLLSAANDLSL